MRFYPAYTKVAYYVRPGVGLTRRTPTRSLTMSGRGVESYPAYTKFALGGLPKTSLAVLRLAKQAVVGPAKPPSCLPIRPEACSAVVGVIQPSSKPPKPSWGLSGRPVSLPGRPGSVLGLASPSWKLAKPSWRRPKV